MEDYGPVTPQCTDYDTLSRAQSCGNDLPELVLNIDILDGRLNKSLDWIKKVV